MGGVLKYCKHMTVTSCIIISKHTQSSRNMYPCAMMMFIKLPKDIAIQGVTRGESSLAANP